MATKDAYDKKDDIYYKHLRPEMFSFLPVKANTFLDIGCAQGEFGKKIKDLYKAEVWGIEDNEKQGEEAAKKLNKVFTGDVMTLLDQLPNHYFDCIICNDILEHLVVPGELLRKLKNKIKPSGYLVCSIPNVRYIRNMLHLIVYKEWRYIDGGILDCTHLRFFTKKSWSYFLTVNGYQIDRIQGINPIKSFTKAGIIYHLLNTIMVRFISDMKYQQFASVSHVVEKSEIDYL